MTSNCQHFPFTHSSGCIALSHCGFNLHFPVESRSWAPFNIDACVLSCVRHVRVFATLGAVVCQALLSMGFSRGECLSGLLCPPPGDLPDPGIKPASFMPPSLPGVFFTSRATWEAHLLKHFKPFKTWAIWVFPFVKCQFKSFHLLNIEFSFSHWSVEILNTAWK